MHWMCVVDALAIYLSVKVFEFVCYLFGLAVPQLQAILLVHTLMSHLVQGLLSVLWFKCNFQLSINIIT